MIPADSRCFIFLLRLYLTKGQKDKAAKAGAKKKKRGILPHFLEVEFFLFL